MSIVNRPWPGTPGIDKASPAAMIAMPKEILEADRDDPHGGMRMLEARPADLREVIGR